MSTNVLTLKPQLRHSEGWRAQTRIGEQGQGFRDRGEGIPEPVFETAFQCRIGPGSNDATYATLKAFFIARNGAYDSFLWKATLVDNHQVVAEAVDSPTPDGVETDFPLDMKHIDASSLVVYIDDVEQTVTTHYTLENNNTTPTISFVSAPSGGEVITADYDFYIPVLWITDALMMADIRTDGGTAGSQIAVSDTIRFRQDSPGSHKV